MPRFCWAVGPCSKKLRSRWRKESTYASWVRTDPGTLHLDEPYTSLDIAARHIFSEKIRGLAERGHTIILVTHEFSEILPEIARVILVKEGRILADGPKDSVLTSDLISRLFDIAVEVRQENERFRASPI